MASSLDTQLELMGKAQQCPGQGSESSMRRCLGCCWLLQLGAVLLQDMDYKPWVGPKAELSKTQQGPTIPLPVPLANTLVTTQDSTPQSIAIHEHTAQATLQDLETGRQGRRSRSATYCVIIPAFGTFNGSSSSFHSIQGGSSLPEGRQSVVGLLVDSSQDVGRLGIPGCGIGPVSIHHQAGSNLKGGLTLC